MKLWKIIHINYRSYTDLTGGSVYVWSYKAFHVSQAFLLVLILRLQPVKQNPLAASNFSFTIFTICSTGISIPKQGHQFPINNNAKLPTWCVYYLAIIKPTPNDSIRSQWFRVDCWNYKLNWKFWRWEKPNLNHPK